MKKITANASNWIDGDQLITITGVGCKRVVKSAVCDEVKVSYQSIGSRSRYNRPTWHVWLRDEYHPEISICIEGNAAIASGYGACRSQQIGGDFDVSDAAAVAAWKLWCNL